MSRRLVLASVLVPGLALAHPCSVHAEMPRREDVPMDHPGARHATHPNLFGSKLGYISLFGPGPEEGAGYEHVPLGYAGLFYERSVIHEWLEIELTAGAAVGAEEIAMPIDLFFKKPFHPSPRATVYVGAGPLVSIVLRPERRVIAGGGVTVGTYLWFSERWGLDLDLDLALGAKRGEVLFELLGAVGPTVRF